MKILLTGSRGFIGINFANFLKSQDIYLQEFDIIDDTKIQPVDLDINFYDWVIHLGAVSSTTETNVKKVLDLNLTWAAELFEQCIKHNVNFQWASSASVYGKRTKDQGPFKLTDTCNPANLYAMSKYLLEQYIIKRNPENIIYQGFRYFNVYGLHEEHKKSQASPYTQFRLQAEKNNQINLFAGSENFYRDFIAVEQLIEYQYKMLNHGKSGIFNVGTGNPKSFLEVAHEIVSKYNASINVIDFPEHLKPHYQEYTCADMEQQ
jgi:ADP-L-glycero-D-manno-heptose 6-epimerase